MAHHARGGAGPGAGATRRLGRVRPVEVKDLKAFQERMGPAYDLVTTKVGKEWMDRVMAAVKQLQIDLIHYSIVVVAATGIGLFLPPIGVGLFISCGIANISVDRAVGPCSRTWRFSAWDCCS